VKEADDVKKGSEAPDEPGKAEGGIGTGFSLQAGNRFKFYMVKF
jgi:hypothetical protein